MLPLPPAVSTLALSSMSRSSVVHLARRSFTSPPVSAPGSAATKRHLHELVCIDARHLSERGFHLPYIIGASNEVRGPMFAQLLLSVHPVYRALHGSSSILVYRTLHDMSCTIHTIPHYVPCAGRGGIPGLRDALLNLRGDLHAWLWGHVQVLACRLAACSVSIWNARSAGIAWISLHARSSLKNCWQRSTS